MIFLFGKILLAAGFLGAGTALAQEAERQDPKALREYRGSTTTEEFGLPSEMVILDAASYEVAWKKIGLKESPGDVNFFEEALFLATTRGSRMGLRIREEGEGKLKVSAIATRDLRPGLRYVFGVFRKKDWKEINGTSVP